MTLGPILHVEFVCTFSGGIDVIVVIILLFLTIDRLIGRVVKASAWSFVGWLLNVPATG